MDLTKLMKGPAEAEPVQEQPKLSREEYAAQKKAEREELWTRIDALTADVFKDGSSLRGFLDFTAQCSPERIENLLLFHSDAPEATWLKTFDEWKQAGRSVRGGEAGYTALIGQDYTREDGTAASGYYVGKKFDVSQTRGRVPFPVSWTVKMKKKQKETQDILSYHSQAAGCSDKARAKASGGRQPIEECGRTGL